MTTFRSEDELRKRPPSGESTWPNNGEVHERLRILLLQQAEHAEADGESDLAADLRSRAAWQRKERDRCYREHMRRMCNRHLAAQRLRRRFPA